MSKRKTITPKGVPRQPADITQWRLWRQLHTAEQTGDFIRAGCKHPGQDFPPHRPRDRQESYGPAQVINFEKRSDRPAETSDMEITRTLRSAGLRRGDVVTISHTGQIEDGQVGYVTIEGSHIVDRIHFMWDKRSIHFGCDPQAYPLHDVQIIGPVIETVRKKGKGVRR
jgi:hypothetical protein